MFYSLVALAPFKVYNFYYTNISAFAVATILFVAVNSCMQLLVLFVNTRGIVDKKMSRKRFFLDTLAVLLSVKPGLAAIRVASGEKPLKGSLMDAR